MRVCPFRRAKLFLTFRWFRTFRSRWTTTLDVAPNRTTLVKPVLVLVHGATESVAAVVRNRWAPWRRWTEALRRTLHGTDLAVQFLVVVDVLTFSPFLLSHTRWFGRTSADCLTFNGTVSVVDLLVLVLFVTQLTNALGLCWNGTVR